METRRFYFKTRIFWIIGMWMKKSHNLKIYCKSTLNVAGNHVELDNNTLWFWRCNIAQRSCCIQIENFWTKNHDSKNRSDTFSSQIFDDMHSDFIIDNNKGLIIADGSQWTSNNYWNNWMNMNSPYRPQSIIWLWRIPFQMIHIWQIRVSSSNKWKPNKILRWNLMRRC